MAGGINKKIGEIVRNRTGTVGLRASIPHVIPSELWKESGRWAHADQEAMENQDRNGKRFLPRSLCEELCTNIGKAGVSSYEKLPLQPIPSKFKHRDESSSKIWTYEIA